MKTTKTKRSGPGRPIIISNKLTRGAIARRYAAGERLDQLAETYGVCVDTIRRIAASEGQPLRPVGRPRKPR